jgi:very-short-patch-repair endonuclease
MINQGLIVLRFRNEEVLNETDRVLSDITARLAETMEK